MGTLGLIIQILVLTELICTQLCKISNTEFNSISIQNYIPQYNEIWMLTSGFPNIFWPLIEIMYQCPGPTPMLSFCCRYFVWPKEASNPG